MLTQQGLDERINELFEELIKLKILNQPKRRDAEGELTNRRNFYSLFFDFWRKSTAHLLEESTFTFEDQKYWNYLDITDNAINGKAPAGLTRYDHIMVDEFQDINPLDIALIKAIVE